MRPTREGKYDGKAPGLIFKGYGVDPGVTVEEPEAPVDRLDDGATAYIPFVSPALGEPTVVQVKQSTSHTATFDTTPTPGNKIFCLVNHQENGVTIDLTTTGLTHIGPQVKAGPSGEQGHARLGYRDVVSSDPTGPWGSQVIGSNKQTTIFEVAGLPSGGPLNSVDATDQTGTGVERAITPSGGVDAFLVGGFGSRLRAASGGSPTFTPNGDTTVVGSLAVNTSMFGNAQPFHGTSDGSAVTLGGTQGGTTQSGTYAYGIVVAAFALTGGDEGLNWVEAPLSIDADDATFEEVDDGSITEAGLAFWRASLADSYLIASLEASIGFQTAGSVTVTVRGANESDYSDAVTVATTTVTATGSLTADDVVVSWGGTDVYQYWELLIDTTDSVRVYEVQLLDPPTFTGAHGDLAGRSDAAQHPADAVSYDPTASGMTATDVQAAIDELEAGMGAGSIIVEETDGTPSVDPTTTIRFPPDTVTDEGSGVVSIRQAPTGFIGARVNNSSSAVSASNVTWTIMTFSTEDYDSDGFHSTSSNTGRHTIPAGLGGKYLLNGGLAFATNSSGQRGYRILKNGTDVIAGAFMNAESSGSVPTRMTFSTVVHLVAGDYVEVQGWHNVTGGGALNMGGDDDYTWWAASKLDSGKVGEGIGCSLYNTSAQSIANGADVALTFGAERFDTDNFHSTSSNTSRVTIPPGLGGKYLVTGAVTWASNTSNGRFLRVRKNGTTNVGTGAQINSPPTGEVAQNFAQVVDLVAGDYVELIVFQNISGGGSLNAGSTNDYQYSRMEVMRLDSGSRNTEIVPRVVQQFTSVVATPLSGTVPQAASDSVLLLAFGSVATPRVPSAITQTNVTWSALLGSASGTGASDARVDLWVGIPTGTPGTSVSVTLGAGATNCTGVYYELPRSLGLAGTVDQNVTRNGGATAATSQLTGLIKPTARNFGVYVCAVANGTFLIQGYGPFISTTDPITFGGFLDVGHRVCEVTPAHHLRASIPVQTSARWANLIADII